MASLLLSYEPDSISLLSSHPPFIYGRRWFLRIQSLPPLCMVPCVIACFGCCHTPATTCPAAALGGTTSLFCRQHLPTIAAALYQHYLPRVVALPDNCLPPHAFEHLYRHLPPARHLQTVFCQRFVRATLIAHLRCLYTTGLFHRHGAIPRARIFCTPAWVSRYTHTYLSIAIPTGLAVTLPPGSLLARALRAPPCA